MKKAIITGGAGFIGSHLADILVERGFNCMVADIFHHNNEAAFRANHKNVTVSNTDIRDFEALSRVIADFKPHSIYHLAAHHFIPFCNDFPVKAMETNIIGTQNVADCCRIHRVPLLFFASTAAVYGISDNPHSEQETPDPWDIYGVTKLAGEKIVSFLSRRGPTRVRIGRYFNAVGSRETNPHVLPEILSQLSSTFGHPIVNLGNITPKRDYIHAADLASASFAMLNAEGIDPLDIANIGSGVEHSVEELVNSLAAILGKPIEIVSDPRRIRAVDRQHLCANTEKIRTSYGWAPKHTIDEVLSELAETIQPSFATTAGA